MGKNILKRTAGFLLLVTVMLQEPLLSAEETETGIRTAVEISKTSVYLWERVLLRYYIYTSGSDEIKIDDIKNVPVAPALMMEKIDENIGLKTVMINGKKMVRRHICTFECIPEKTGTLETGTGSAVISYDRGSGLSGFSRIRYLMFEKRKIKVLPLPAKGRPHDYSGHVGNFRIKVSGNNRRVNLSEMTVLTISVEGTGNIYGRRRPVLVPGYGFNCIIMEEKTRKFTEGGKVRVRNTYSLNISPLVTGKLDVGYLKLDFFDPEKRRYATVKSERIYLDVTDGKK